MSAKVFIPILVWVLGSRSREGLPVCHASSSASPQAQEQTATGQSAIAKSIGVIKAIDGSAITVAPASGPEVAVTVQPNARILRLASGDKDLKNAAPLPLRELQVGDTIRVRGLSSDGAKSIAALEIIVITHLAVEAVTDQMRQDWQKRGIAGLVDSVDAASGTVTISIPGFGEKKTVAIHTSKSTVIRRYAPDSANFDAARPSTLQAIHANDQLRARGDRSADGSEFTAAEIVTGTFPYVEGTVKAVDASAGTISVQDVLSKKTVQLRITADSQLHRVPAEMAQRMAFMLKRAKAQGVPGALGAGSSATTPGSGPGAPPASPGGPPAGGMMPGGANAGVGGSRAGGASGFQRMLDQTPAVALADLRKGDALVILATEGAQSGGGTVIKLFSGVEPILEAAPNASQAMMLAPWSLGGAPNGDAANP
jgi:hypothetical protein